jgi:hypothetical protein
MYRSLGHVTRTRGVMVRVYEQTALDVCFSHTHRARSRYWVGVTSQQNSGLPATIEHFPECVRP